MKNNSHIDDLFIQSLFQKEELKTDYCVSGEGTIMMGETNSNSRIGDIRIFDRCYHKKVQYQSKIYIRPKKTINYFAQLNDGKIVEIQNFLLIDNKCFINVRYLTVSNLHNFNVSHISLVENFTDTVHKISIECVKSKVIFLEIFDTKKRYICVPLNKIMSF